MLLLEDQVQQLELGARLGQLLVDGDLEALLCGRLAARRVLAGADGARHGKQLRLVDLLLRVAVVVVVEVVEPRRGRVGN